MNCFQFGAREAEQTKVDSIYVSAQKSSDANVVIA